MTVEEAERLAVVSNLELLDGPPSPRVERVARLAQQLLGLPLVSVNILDADRTVSVAGPMEGRQMPRGQTFCPYVLRSPGLLVVPDARADDRFCGLASVVGDPHLRFYAGAPLTVDGQRVGTLCVVGQEPGDLDERQRQALVELAGWVEEELTRGTELARAGEVQRRLLPSRPPEVSGFSLAGHCVQSRGVGGDFYDWYLAQGRLQVVLADVMGKGLGAAIIAAGVRAMLRGASRYNELGEAVTRAARALGEDLEGTGTFVTVFGLRVDCETGEAQYVDAGHGLAVVLQGDGSYRRLSGWDPPLGVVRDHRWEVASTVLEPGETMLAVSDGLLDFFDNPREAVAAAAEAAAQSETVAELVATIADFAAQRSPLDDVSVLALRRDR
ncbi:PP2C family protein-serine/threonine phosphatase [Ornithinicoccus halotolerans]|uniref:PP2C family protein-serine/threonine phosphatase n=1 Tax=Ornithinicoccus halotolerans TaxID=1748220 RepID=UPI001885B540|nr:SpoIIE family protein phosphatase [Ornithinicoccus halotolerans]